MRAKWETITITLEEDGSFLIDFDGYAGNACREAGQDVQATLSTLGVEWSDEHVTAKEGEGLNPLSKERRPIRQTKQHRSQRTLRSTRKEG